MPASPPEVTGPPLLDLSPGANSLLGSLELARDLLARRLVQENHAIADHDLNHTIHSSLLQVLFLRTGQEYGFVGSGILSLLADSDGIAKRMARACVDAGLSPEVFFEKGPERSHPAPAVPDDALREFIGRAAVTEFPAPLSVIPPEELAIVFEYFLGTRLLVAEGYRVKKAGKSAVLYTGTIDVPSMQVVGSMVNGTLRDLTRNGAAGERKSLRILDPACGAGIFLLAVFRFLAREGVRHAGDPQGAAGALPGIVGRSVFGTDIDPESISAARFVLLLACIEEMRLSGCAPIPSGRIREICACLAKTVRCGNALIAPEYFSEKQEHPFNADERRKVNPFSWENTFPEIISAGGFDAIIGAPPPYRPFPVRAREEYFQTHYETYAQGAGLYSYFIERGLCLLAPDGYGTFLVPEPFLRLHHARPLRRLLLSRQILEIADTGRTRLLQDGAARVYLLRIRNRQPDRPFVVSHAHHRGDPDRSPGDGGSRFTFDQSMLGDGGWNLEDTRAAVLTEKLRTIGTPLDHYVMGQIESGTQRIKNNPFVVDEETRTRLTGKEGRCRQFFVPLLSPSDIRRYVPERPSRYLITAQKRRLLKKCRALGKYLGSVPENPAAGSGSEGDAPAPAHADKPVPAHHVPKIIFAPYQHVPAFTFDRSGSYAITGSLLSISRNDPYLAAILNSSLARFIITHICPLTDRGYHSGPGQLGKFPVITPDFDKLMDKTRHDKMVALVTQMLSLHDYLQKAKTDQERRLVQQEIDATDVKIDALVYELYGLTAEEIAVVEGS